MNTTIMRFTAMSACLDPVKLVYVVLIGFVMPLAIKVVSILHGASDSQTFEMLTGKVGVAFVLMVLCLGLAGNGSTQTGRGGEYLALIFTRPITRWEYVLSKWLVITAIGGMLTALQNVCVALLGAVSGETITAHALASMVLERFLDAGLISAAMILTMVNRNSAFQIVSVLAFYIWLAGQTIPPVSVTGAVGGMQDLSIEATKFMCNMSQYISDLILPTVNAYDLMASSHFLQPMIAYISALTLYLTLAVVSLSRREFFYGTN